MADVLSKARDPVLVRQADRGGHLEAGHVQAGLPRQALQRGGEAGGVSGGEELLGVGPVPTRPTELHRAGQLEIEDTVIADDLAVAAAAGGCGDGVENAHVSFWIHRRSRDRSGFRLES
jgi:hypothetical protein